MIAGGEAKARDIRQPMNVAIVDNGGNLLALARMDGAWKGSVDISINKAFTSAMFKLSTEGLAEKAQPEEPFFSIHVSNQGGVMIFPGRIPLKQDGECIGAVGVGGGDSQQDQTVGDAAIPNDGEVRFHEAPQGPGTEVHLAMRFDPPAGALGRAAIKMLGPTPQRLASRALLRFRNLVETDGTPAPLANGALHAGK